MFPKIINFRKIPDFETLIWTKTKSTSNKNYFKDERFMVIPSERKKCCVFFNFFFFGKKKITKNKKKVKKLKKKFSLFNRATKQNFHCIFLRIHQ